MKIAVRLDDITPDMDWEGFLRFKALLDRYQVKPLIGVIPQNRDENVKGSGKARGFLGIYPKAAGGRLGGGYARV